MQNWMDVDFLASHIYYNYYLQSFLDYGICHEQNNRLQKQLLSPSKKKELQMFQTYTNAESLHV